MSLFSKQAFRSRLRPRRSTSPYCPRYGQTVVVVLVLLLLWSLCLGIGLAQAVQPRSIGAIAQTSPTPTGAPVASPASGSGAAIPGTIGTVDIVPAQYKLGQQLYLETCAGCHIGIPPAVMPTETWRQLLQDPQHYGAILTPLTGSSLVVVWDYLRQYSRPQSAEEEVPYRLYQSNIFKSLHPRVKLPSRTNLTSCVSCHPGVGKYDFRSLSAEWQNAP